MCAWNVVVRALSKLKNNFIANCRRKAAFRLWSASFHVISRVLRCPLWKKEWQFVLWRICFFRNSISTVLAMMALKQQVQSVKCGSFYRNSGCIKYSRIFVLRNLPKQLHFPQKNSSSLMNWVFDLDFILDARRKLIWLCGVHSYESINKNMLLKVVCLWKYTGNTYIKS